MANLYDLLTPSQVKPQNSLQQLTDVAGMPIAPTTPAAAAAIGATPDQAKMAGTNVQVKSALDQGLAAGQQRGAIQAPATNYAQQALQQQSQTVKSALDQGLAAKANQWSASLGSFGDMVNNAVSNVSVNIQQPTMPAATNVPSSTTASSAGGMAPTIDQTYLEGLTAAGLTSTQQNAALQAASNYSAALSMPAGPARDAALNKAVDNGQTALGTLGKFEDMFLSSKAGAGTDLANAISGGVQTNLTVSDIQKTPQWSDMFGAGKEWSSQDDMAKALGIDPAQLGSMTVSQLRDASSAALAKSGFSQQQKLIAQLSDPTLSATERQAARKGLADLGTSGVKATDQEIGDLQNHLSQATTVTEGGVKYDVADLLSNSHISAAVTAYLDGVTGAGDALPAGLKSFIDTNKPAFDAIQQQASAQSAEAATINANWNTALSNLAVPGAAGMSDAHLQKLLGSMGIDTAGADWKSAYSQDKVDEVTKSPLYQYVANNSSLAPTAMTHVNDLINAGVDPKALTSLSTDDLATIGLGDDTKWPATQKFLVDQNNIINNGADPMSVFGAAGESIDAAKASLDTDIANKALANLTGQSYTSPISKMDANGDGKVTPEEVKQFVTDPKAVVSLAGQTLSDPTDLYSTLGTYAAPLKNAGMTNGTLTMDNVAHAVVTQPLDPVSLDTMIAKYPSLASGISTGIDLKARNDLGALGIHNNSLDVISAVASHRNNNQVEYNADLANQIDKANVALSGLQTLAAQYAGLPGAPDFKSLATLLENQIASAKAYQVTPAADSTDINATAGIPTMGQG